MSEESRVLEVAREVRHKRNQRRNPRKKLAGRKVLSVTAQWRTRARKRARQRELRKAKDLLPRHERHPETPPKTLRDLYAKETV